MLTENYATIALLNGKIVTVDQDDNVHEAVAVRGNKIVAVGSVEDIGKYIGPETEVVELGGKAVLPGFVDSHIHLVGAGKLAVKAEKEVDIKYCDSVGEVLEKIGERAKATPKGEWVVGWGYLWSRFEEKRAPYAHELDGVAPDNPVLLQFSAMGVANSTALKIAGITKNTVPEYGHVEMDPETGEPNGRLQGGAAVRLVSNCIPPWDIEPIEITKKALDQWIRWGVTCGHQAGQPRKTPKLSSCSGSGASWICVGGSTSTT